MQGEFGEAHFAVALPGERVSGWRDDDEILLEQWSGR